MDKAVEISGQIHVMDMKTSGVDLTIYGEKVGKIEGNRATRRKNEQMRIRQQRKLKKMRKAGLLV